jgi:hypothetical protein
MQETGAVATVKEIAAQEKINESYVSRVLRLTLLAPEIVEAILDGRQALELTLPVLMGPFPLEWGKQRRSCLAACQGRLAARDQFIPLRSEKTSSS